MHTHRHAAAERPEPPPVRHARRRQQLLRAQGIVGIGFRGQEGQLVPPEPEAVPPERAAHPADFAHGEEARADAGWGV